MEPRLVFQVVGGNPFETVAVASAAEETATPAQTTLNTPEAASVWAGRTFGQEPVEENLADEKDDPTPRQPCAFFF